MRYLLALAALALLLVPAAMATPSGSPDLIVDAAAIQPVVSVEYFDPLSCAVQEGEISAGFHRLVRFNTETANVGDGDLKLGKPDANDPNWAFYTCHNHWHFVPYAEYLLRDGTGNVVGIGHKQSFCIIDVIPYLNVKHPRQRHYWNCGQQGLDVGWADVYDAGLDGQWVVIDGLAPGTYNLEITVNYADVLPESNYANNSVSVSVDVP